MSRSVDGDICGECGREYAAVFNVPSSVWRLIAPLPETLGECGYGGGMLCPDCAAIEAKKLGIRLVFNGEVWSE